MQAEGGSVLSHRGEAGSQPLSNKGADDDDDDLCS